METKLTAGRPSCSGSMASVGITFGAMCPLIVEQLTAQGFTASQKDLLKWQKLADAITLLAIHGLIPDSEKQRARKRLVRIIGTHAEPMTVEVPS